MSEQQPGRPEPADAHLDLDALADLLAAEGSEAEVDHVSRCAGCAARLAELDEAQAPVAAALAALPAPPMPPGLADRLSASLADAGPLPAVEPRDGPDRPTALPPPDDREELERAAAPVAPGGSRTVTPLQGSGGGRSRRTWLPAAAVAVLALSAGGLAIGTSPLGGGDDSDTASTSAEGGGAGGEALQEDTAAGLVTSESGQDYAAPGVVEQVLPEVLRGEEAGPSAAEAAPAPPADQQDADATMSTQMRGSGAELDRLREPGALQDCLRALLPADGSVQPLALDYASYAGQPALAVVLESSDPAKVDVFVVGPDCASGKDSTLFFTRVDRP